MREEDVKRAVKRHLDREGYMEVDSREKHENGPDLVFRDRRCGRYISIEAKGDTDGKRQKENKILTALGQTVTRFAGHPNRLYGIAVPADWQSQILRKLSRDAMGALKLRLFLVETNGRVTEINQRNFKSAAASAK